MYRIYSEVNGGWQFTSEIPEGQFNIDDYADQTGVQIEYTPIVVSYDEGGNESTGLGSVTTIVLSVPLG